MMQADWWRDALLLYLFIFWVMFAIFKVLCLLAVCVFTSLYFENPLPEISNFSMLNMSCTAVDREDNFLKGTYYAHFARCNLSLRRPKNVSLKFQLKIPHRSFITPCPKLPFLGRSKNARCLCVCLFKCK